MYNCHLHATYARCAVRVCRLVLSFIQSAADCETAFEPPPFIQPNVSNSQSTNAHAQTSTKQDLNSCYSHSTTTTIYRRSPACGCLLRLAHTSLTTNTAVATTAAVATSGQYELRCLPPDCCCMWPTMSSTTCCGDGGPPVSRLENSSVPSSVVTSKAPMRGGLRLPITSTDGRRAATTALI